MENLKVYFTGPWQTRGNNCYAPVIMMREGVHNGSSGRVYWPPHVLEENAEKWENAPVCLDHPTENGRFVSINTNAKTKRSIVGKVVNARYDGERKALRGLIEIPRNHPRLPQIKQLKEVSIGVFSEETETFGEWVGEEYDLCAVSMQPDHLALLNDSQGACSFRDGCGIRVNNCGCDGEKPLFPPEVDDDDDPDYEEGIIIPAIPPGKQGGDEEPLYPPEVEKPSYKPNKRK